MKERRGTPRDMTAPNWKRTVGRLRKYAQVLKEYDFQVIEPDNFETPPDRRIANSSEGLA